MTKQRKLIWVSGIILCYVAVAIIGFFIVYFIKNLYGGTPKSNEEPTPKIATAAAGFRAYSFEDKQHATIEYPSDLSVKESSYGLGVKTVELRSDDNKDPDYAPDFQRLRVPKNLAKAVGQDFDSYYQMNDGETKIIKSPTSNDKESFTKVRNRMVDGKNAVDYRSVPSPDPGDEEAEVGTIIDAGDSLILITTGESQRGELDTMLESFKTQE
jgi:hypothetical protein